MDASAILLLVSAVGVAFGWQPMPDGSHGYEYIVQVEPELAATLADGMSIPIVSDVPDEIHPISRIRLVVGREQPPRQRLVTHLKPVAEGSTPGGSGVELAQYNPYADPRYSAAPAPQQPAPSTGQPQSPAENPYPQSAATAGQAAEAAWNNEPEAPPITPTGERPPSGQELFGKSSANANTWNGAAVTVQSVAERLAAAPLDQVGQEIQRAAAPVQQGVQQGINRLDSEVRGAVDRFGDRTKSLVDELREPFQQPQLPADARAQATPPATSGSEQSWNQEPPPNTNPLRMGAADPSSSTWNGQAAASPPTKPQSPAGATAPPFTSPQAAAGSVAGTAADSEWNGTQQPAGDTLLGATVAQPQQRAPGDPWAHVPDPRPQSAAGVGVRTTQTGAPADGSSVAVRTMPFGGIGGDPAATGPQFPPLGNPPATQQPPTSVAATPPSGGVPNQSPAKIGRNMLNEPADRALDGLAAQPAPSTPTQATPVSQPTPTNPWGAKGQSAVAAATTATPATGQTTAPPARDNTVAVLLAWVLLSGSIAGNLYLFWSYLDVRQKYRALVRKTARAVGSRFSAA